jgi:hypothetical protein
MAIDEPVPIDRSRRTGRRGDGEPGRDGPISAHREVPDPVDATPVIGPAAIVPAADRVTVAEADLGVDRPGLLDLRRTVRWAVVLTEEVAMVPWTIREVRRSLVSLPDRLDRLTNALEETMAGLDSTLPRLNRSMEQVTDGVDRVEFAVGDLTGELSKTVTALDRLLPELSGFIETGDTKLTEMNDSVSELGDMARGVLGAIPGVRRTVRRPPG